MNNQIRILCALTLLAAGCGPQPGNVSGELKQWHRVTLDFNVPATDEKATPNPFLDYRLSAAFAHAESGRTMNVQGFYAADGHAAETSADAGAIWRVRFTPPLAGEWSYVVSFRTGEGVALNDDPAAGERTAFDGSSGSFTAAAGDKQAPDFRARGMLEYVGKHHLQFAGDKSWFLKGGADSPENFLGYADFDGTYDMDVHEGVETDKEKFLHEFAPHAADWSEGDPSWQGGKGKNIIGAVNYLASKGMNSVYFLTYNIDGGDGKDTWMWTEPEERERFDVSKLAQWEIVFSHMDKLGLMLHVITHETENDEKLGGGPDLNDVRKLYLRELVARFAHHPAVMWNLGEENDMPSADRKEIAAYIRALDPYDHPITVHSHNNAALESTYTDLFGDPNFEATSIQGKMENYNKEAVALRKMSAEAGRPWAIFGDEQSSARVGVMPDKDDPDHDIPRTMALWGNLMGGGSGVEWYFGYAYDHMDLNAEDWRSRDLMWDQTRHALEFFHKYVPFWETEPNNELVSAKGALAAAREPDLYVVYLPAGGTTDLTLPEGDYSVDWYDPRSGGQLAKGSVETVAGAGARAIGDAPSEPTKDWAVLIRKK